MIWVLVTVELSLTAPVSSILQDEVHVLLQQACKMETFDFDATIRLTDTLLHLIDCTCEDLPVSNATVHVEKRLTSTTIPPPATPFFAPFYPPLSSTLTAAEKNVSSGMLADCGVSLSAAVAESL